MRALTLLLAGGLCAGAALTWSAGRRPAATAAVVGPGPAPVRATDVRPADRPLLAAGPGPAVDVREHLERQLAGEPPEPGWSAAAEGELRDGFAALGQLEVSDCACKATLCRVEVVHRDRLAQDRFLALVGLPPPFDEGTAVHKLPAPALHTVVFVARDGHELPAFP